MPFLNGQNHLFFRRVKLFRITNSQVHFELTPFDTRKLLVSSDFPFKNFSLKRKKATVDLLDNSLMSEVSGNMLIIARTTQMHQP